MTETPAIYIAKESAVLRLSDGDKVVIRKDRTRVRAGHPMIDQYPGYFREVDPESDVHHESPDYEIRRAEQAAAEAAAEQAAAEAEAAAKAAAEKPKRGGGSSS